MAGQPSKGRMTTSTHLIRSRRFLPLFVTQLLNAFNDNLYRNAMVFFVVYTLYNSEAAEGLFSAVASALFIAPFFLLSALAGQLADMRDKARIIRIVKASEMEATLKRLLAEIEATKRRVNALEFKVIPELEEAKVFIQLRLEEMEREEKFRLKRFKNN